MRNQCIKVYRVFRHNQLKGEGKMKKIGLIISGFFVSSLLFCACGSFPSSSVGGPGKVLNSPDGESDDQKVVTFYVIGKGLEPENALSKGEAVLMAERAAVADGYRQLVEKISGVYVDALTRAGYGAVDQDRIVTRTQSWLRGVEVLEIRKSEYGVTEAQMQLSIYFAKKNMIWWPAGLGNGAPKS